MARTETTRPVARQSRHLLWVDDNDDRSVLWPLSLILEKNGFRISRAQSYVSGLDLLEDSLRLKGTDRHTLLTDPLLPYMHATGTLSSQLGVKLAKIAAQRGMTRVVFFTVCTRREMVEHMAMLRKSCPNTTFEHQNKAGLFMRNEVDNFLRKLGQ